MNRYTVDLVQIRRNIKLIRSHLKEGTRIMMMVKSNAYGIGDAALCRFLPKCDIDIVGVAGVLEAEKLRQEGITLKIFVFQATEGEISLIIKNNTSVATSTLTFTKALAEAATQADVLIPVHIHLDTGMTRFGANFHEALAIAHIIESCPHLFLEGILSHFPCADQPPKDAFSISQITQLLRFKTALKEKSLKMPNWTHIGNSAGMMRFPLDDCNMVRLGIEAYGIRPSSAYPATITKCALSLRSTLLQVSLHPKGTGVSYGHINTTDRPTQVGVIPMGYFDGLHRKYHTSTPFVKGLPVPILGNITMDFTMVDVTDTGAKEGDPVTLFGFDENGNFVDPLNFAEKSGTIAHELITCIGPRIPRTYLS